MNEMKLLEEFRAAVEPPDAGTLAGARARVLGSVDSPVRPGRRRRGTRRPAARPWLVPLGAAVAVAAVAVTTAIVIPGGPGATRGGQQLTAAAVLQRAARAALAAPRPGRNQFIRSDTVTRTPGQPNSATQLWLSVDGKRTGSAHQAGCGLRGDPGCWMTAIPIGPLWFFFTYTRLEKLPTASGALLDYLLGEQAKACRGVGQLDRASLEWSGIYTILSDVTVLPPRFGAALFRAAARIPDVVVIRNARTAAGQHGIAVARAVHLRTRSAYAARAEFIFDPRTYRYIGNVIKGTITGHHLQSSAPLSVRFVDSAPPGKPGFGYALPECIGL